MHARRDPVSGALTDPLVEADHNSFASPCVRVTPN
jgi:hypothetical protein